MARIPSKSEILDWITDNPSRTAKRDIARAFGIRGAQRIDLKRILKEMEAEGTLQKRRNSYQDGDKLPPVSVLQVIAPDEDGDLLARPMEWNGKGEPPTFLLSLRNGDPALGGERVGDHRRAGAVECRR